MVISVDTGNKMIKTEHYEFNSGIDVLDTIPGENDEVIEFGGKYYRTTNRRISYMEDKTEDDRYYILTLIAIAKELDTMKKEAILAPNELIEIELLVGLPPAHYGKYRKKFQQYFQRDGKVVRHKDMVLESNLVNFREEAFFVREFKSSLKKSIVNSR